MQETLTDNCRIFGVVFGVVEIAGCVANSIGIQRSRRVQLEKIIEVCVSAEEANAVSARCKADARV